MENLRTWGFKSLLILCVCIFCVYEIQEVALDNLNNSHLVAPQPALSLLQLHNLADHEENHQVIFEDDGQEKVSLGAKRILNYPSIRFVRGTFFTIRISRYSIFKYFSIFVTI